MLQTYTLTSSWLQFYMSAGGMVLQECDIQQGGCFMASEVELGQDGDLHNQNSSVQMPTPQFFFLVL